MIEKVINPIYDRKKNERNDAATVSVLDLQEFYQKQQARAQNPI